MTLLLGFLASLCLAYAVRWAVGRVTGRLGERALAAKVWYTEDNYYG